MPLKEPDAGNILLGSGKLYIDRYVSGAPSGNERFVGNCTKFALSPNVETIEKKSSTDPARPTIRRDTTGSDMNISIILDEYDKHNLALALLGTAGTYNQTGTSVTNEVHNDAEPGTYVSLLFRGISAVTVEPSGGGTAYVLNTDYEIDAQEGRIYIKPGGAITSGTDIQVDYTYATQALDAVHGGTASTVRCKIRYVSNNPDSPETTAFVWRASLTGSGETGLLSDDYASFELTGLAESDAANHPSNPTHLIIFR